MGREANCEARFAGKASRGKALLETSELIFRGDFRVVVPFKEMTKISADASNLTVAWSGGTLALTLGADAARWAERIRHPPTRLDKLGVKPTSTVVLVARAQAFGGVELDTFVGEVESSGATVSTGKPNRDVDLLFVAIESKGDLRQLPRLVASLRPDAAIWLLRPKGSAAVTEADVRTAGRAAGLVDVKVAAFSSGITAEKFVVPTAARAKKKAATKPRRLT
jgi:hypothetical protein